MKNSFRKMRSEIDNKQINDNEELDDEDVDDDEELDDKDINDDEALDDVDDVRQEGAVHYPDLWCPVV